MENILKLSKLSIMAAGNRHRLTSHSFRQDHLADPSTSQVFQSSQTLRSVNILVLRVSTTSFPSHKDTDGLAGKIISGETK